MAIERATKLAADLHQGTYRPVPAAFPIQQAVTDYILVLQTDGRARKTVVKYAGVFKIFLAFLAGRRVTNLSQVTA